MLVRRNASARNRNCVLSTRARGAGTSRRPAGAGLESPARESWPAGDSIPVGLMSGLGMLSPHAPCAHLARHAHLTRMDPAGALIKAAYLT